MAGLVLVKIDPFYESLFFVGVITFLLRFLGLLIQDLDNPFGYYEGDSVEDVSLKPLDDVIARLREIDEHVDRTVESGDEAKRDVPVSRNHYLLKPRTL